MKPRLITSKKWTPFPKDYVSQIEQAFSDAFPGQFKDSKLIIEGRIYPEEILLRVGHLEKGRLVQNNFEVSANYSQKKQDAVTCIYQCIDAAASLMNEFIESQGEVEFPRSWKDYDFDGTMIWVQYTTENTHLESEANRLLGVEEAALVHEEDSEDALALSEEVLPRPESEDGDETEEAFETEDDNEEDDVDLSKPSLFSGKKKQKKEDMH